MSIAENLETIHEHIENDCRSRHADNGPVKLVAVSKYHTVDEIKEAYKDGQRAFGENRVQELLPKIDALAERKLQLTLSVSLHAPDNTVRSSMMPINDAYPLEKLIPACRRYQKTTGRRISFEYSMVRGVNDSPEMARKLAELIRGMGAHVNLIPINPVDGSPYSATDARNVQRFRQMLEDLGVNATVRRRLGADISAACGQLRREDAAQQQRKDLTNEDRRAH